MTKRAILWCGHSREPNLTWDDLGRPRESGDPLIAADDATIQCNSLELAYRAALALGVPPHEIYACVFRDDFLPPDLDSRRNHSATVSGLQRLVRSLVRVAEPDDALLFVAVNHANKIALITADPVDEFDEDPSGPRLTPAVLEACLNQLPGPQVVVVSTCHAGIFLPLASREARAVLVACAADAVYLVPRGDCKWPAFLDEIFGAWCGCALSDAVPREQLSLDDAFLRAASRLADEQTPLRAGAASWPAGDAARSG